MEIILILIGIVEMVVLLKLDKFSFNKYSKYKWVALCYVISVLFNYIILINIEYINNIIITSDKPNIERILIIIFSMGTSLVYSPIFIVIIQRLHEGKIIKKYEKKTEVIEYEYYRSVLNEVSPAIIAYCNNKKIKVEDNIVAILLNLQLRNVIKIEGNKIEVLEDINSLLEHEKMVLEKIQYKRYDEKFYKKIFKNTLISDMINKQYIVDKTCKESNVTYFMEMIMAWLIIYILSTVIIFVKISDMGLILFLVYAVTFLCIPIYKFIQSKIKVIVKKQKALELAAKIKGVKRYIEDFSNIKHNKIDIIKLYEEFVIYAIILDIKGKLNDECEKMYEKTKNMILMEK